MHTCPNCGKDVAGNMTDPCPKCGFDPTGASRGQAPASGDPAPSIRLRIPRSTTTGGTVPAPNTRGWGWRWPRRRKGS